MKLWMSGEVQSDIVDSYRKTRNEVEAEVNRLLGEASIEANAEEWAVIPIILNENTSSQYPEVVKRSSRGKTVEFRLHISHAEFLAASPSQRTDLILKVLSHSVGLMGKLGVSPDAQRSLHDVLSQAEKNLGVLN
jgi:hypothetical protein